MTSGTETSDFRHGESRLEDLSLGTTLRFIQRVFARTWRGLLLADVIFKAFQVLLSLGYTGIVISQVMAQTGRSAVTNTDIASFLLHPTGLFLAFVGAAGALFLVMVEQAVLMSVAAILFYRPEITGRNLVRAVGAAAQRIARLAGLLVGITVAVVLPPAAISALLYKLVLGGHDINYYLSTRPPAFLAVAGVAAALHLGAGAMLACFYVRAILTVPILLSERVYPIKTIRESFARTRGAGWRVAALLAVWHVSWFLFGWLCLEGCRYLADLGFKAAHSTAGAVSVAATAVVGLAIGAAALSFGSWTGHALLVLKLYASLHPEGWRPEPVPELPGGTGKDTRLSLQIAATGTLFLAAVLVVSVILVNGLSRVRHVEITAHRGYSRVAPENTLSAVRRAIEAGADWAEIDVQETRDGVVVVIHDRDLMRLAGDPRRVEDLTFEELEGIDVGSPFDPAFAGERVPSLEEVITLSRGKIKLNIELKYYGGDPRLARDVARIIREKGFEGECFVASLNYPALLDVKRENTAVRTGAIVTAGIGDITRLDADVLSVNAGLVNFRFLRKVRTSGKELHVWTVDDERVAQALMGRGVANIITNDPVAMGRARSAWEAVSPAEKVLLTAGYVLGLRGKQGQEEIASQGDL